MKTRLLLFLYVLLCISCKKDSPNQSVPSTPLPTITLSAIPSSTILYGDSVTVSYTSTNANGANGMVKIRPLKDSTITRTVVGPGGSVTGTITITVLPPDTKTVLLTTGSWKLSEIKRNNPDGSWTPYIVQPCQQTTTRTFYLYFKEFNSNDCNPGFPPLWADWKWKPGSVSNRDSLDWGSKVYGLHELNTTKLVLRDNSPNFPSPGFTLFELTYTK